MKIKYCSFTGADDGVSPYDLEAISARHPIVEWAILYSPALAGTPRYPTSDWIESFHGVCPKVQKAVHLCNEALQAFVAGDQTTLGVIKKFDRVQLNVGFNGMIDQIDVNQLVAQVRSLPEQKFIFQTDTNTQPYLKLFEGINNLALLLDGSAGQGISPDRWPHPVPGRFCGYAGGIGPDNIGQTLDILSGIVAADQEIWTDKETRIRTYDKFDLNKVRSVAETVDMFAAKHLQRHNLSLSGAKL